MDDIRRALTATPASVIVERLGRLLAGEYGVTDVELLLVDYRLTSLLPLLTSPPDGRDLGTATGGPAWRCFDGQRPVSDGAALYVPVTMRGERLGVLRLEPAASRSEELTALGSVLAHEIAAARSTTDRYLVGARARRLTLAAEMQWETLPGRSCSAEEFTLAGQLEPAYSVRGDTFDWAANVDHLVVSVIDGMGEGVAAASLSILATSALRNARRAGLDIADQASMADAALYAHFRGSQYVSVLLLDVHLRTGRVKVIDTGSPLLILLRGDEMSELTFARHDPLGMFDGSEYQMDEFQLEPGDRVVILSDGIHAATVDGRRYGTNDLRRLIRRTRPLPPLDVVRTVVTGLDAFVSGKLSDDAAAACLDWHGSKSLQ